MMAKTAAEQQEALLAKAQGALTKAQGRLDAATEKAKKAEDAKASANLRVEHEQAEVARLERHVDWVKNMPTGPAPVAADEAFGDEEVPFEQDTELVGI